MTNPVNWYEGYTHKTQPLIISQDKLQGAVILIVSIIGCAIICLFSSCDAITIPARAEEFSNEQIVEAIGKAEGGDKAAYLYGIRSIDTKNNKDYARKICLNSVRNGRTRWIKAGQPDDLITFIGRRFCPPAAHKLNSNWVKNVNYFLQKNKVVIL